MKIKLMIISLVAGLGLHGSDRGQLVSMKDEEALKKAFIHCVDSTSYASNNCKRPITVCCFKETNNKDEVHNLTKKVIDNECKNLDVGFAKLADVYLYSGANIKIKNAESNQWMELIDHDIDNKRVTMCMVYNITNGEIQEDLANINTLINQNKRTPLLIAGTSSDFIAVFKVLETDTKNFNPELASELVKLSKELVVNEVDKAFKCGPFVDELLQRSDNLTITSKAFQSNNNKSQPGYIAIAKNFFTNRWVMVGGISFAAFLIYYYTNLFVKN